MKILKINKAIRLGVSADEIMASAVWENYDPVVHCAVRECLDKFDSEGVPYPYCFVVGTAILRSLSGVNYETLFNLPVDVMSDSTSSLNTEYQICQAVRKEVIPKILKCADVRSHESNAGGDIYARCV